MFAYQKASNRLLLRRIAQRKMGSALTLQNLGGGGQDPEDFDFQRIELAPGELTVGDVRWRHSVVA